MEQSAGTVRPAEPQERSAGELVKELTELVPRLVRDEIKLAQVDMAQKGKQLGIGVGAFAGSGLIALYAAGCLLACAIIAISGVVAAWLAALIVGAALLAVSGIAALIGKSRLTREFADWARDAGGTVLAGRCSSTAGDVPFRPLREALLAAARVGLAPSSRLAAFRPTLGSLVPEWAGEHAVGLDGGLIVLAEGVLRLLVEWSSPDAPALLVIEDVHWADRETLQVIE